MGHESRFFSLVYFGFLSCLCVWIGVTIWKTDDWTWKKLKKMFF